MTIVSEIEGVGDAIDKRGTTTQQLSRFGACAVVLPNWSSKYRLVVDLIIFWKIARN
jgi:hypothetical protein